MTTDTLVHCRSVITAILILEQDALLNAKLVEHDERVSNVLQAPSILLNLFTKSTNSYAKRTDEVK